MDLVSGMFFGHGVANTKRYWQGDSGDEDLTWEIVMEPPIEVVGHVCNLPDGVAEN